SYPTAYTPLPPRRPLAPLPAHLPPLFTPLPLPAALPIYGLAAVDQLRGLRSQGRLPRLGSTDVVLVIDGFGALRDDFADLDEPVADLLKRGGGYGIHVVAGMLRWNDVRIATQSLFGTRVEL